MPGISVFLSSCILHKILLMKNISFYRNIRTGLAGIAMLLVLSVSDAQPKKSFDELQQQVEKSRRDLDSLTQRNEAITKKMTDSINAQSIARMNENSYNWISQYQAEKKKKQKQKAIMYLSFGGAMLAVLVFSLARRKKKTS